MSKIEALVDLSDKDGMDDSVVEFIFWKELRLWSKVVIRVELVELKPISEEEFKVETLSELFDWDWIVEIVVSFIVVKLRLGEEISFEDCSTALILELLLVKAVVSWIELEPKLEDATKTEILSDGMVILVVEFSKELEPWFDFVIKAELNEVRLLSDETFKGETLPVLSDWDWIVEIVVSSNVLKPGLWKEMLDNDWSTSFVLKMLLEKAVLSWVVLKPSLDDVCKTEAFSELSVKYEMEDFVVE